MNELKQLWQKFLGEPPAVDHWELWATLHTEACGRASSRLQVRICRSVERWRWTYQVRFASKVITEGADAKRIRMTALRVAQIRRFPDSVPAVEVYRRLGLDKESRAAQCQVSRDMKSGGFASRRVNGQWVWQRALGSRRGRETLAGRY